MPRRASQSRLITRSLLIALVVSGIIIGGLAWRHNQSATPAASLPSTNLVSNAPYSIAVTPAASDITVGDTVRLNFTVRREGAISDIYREQKVVHYVIASANYHDFFHTFAPEVAGPGAFYLDHAFTQPGAYRIWTELVDTTKGKELHHGEHAELVSYVDLTVNGTEPSASLNLVTAPTVAVSKWRVVSERTGLKAGSPTSIRLHIEDRAGTVLPVFPAEPAIYVMVGPNLTFFRHTHTQPAIEGRYIELTETFPEPGTYLFFAEVYVQEADAYQAIQVPFALTIE